jgi:hypothetical protein
MIPHNPRAISREQVNRIGNFDYFCSYNNSSIQRKRRAIMRASKIMHSCVTKIIALMAATFFAALTCHAQADGATIERTGEPAETTAAELERPDCARPRSSGIRILR